MDPQVLEECFAEMSEALFDGDMAAASKLLVSSPLLLPQSDRLGPLVTLMTGELEATLSQVKRQNAKCKKKNDVIPGETANCKK